MSVDLSLTSRRRRVRPPIMLLYGPKGSGKTSLAAGAPNAIIARCEDGTGTLDAAVWPLDRSEGGTGRFKSLGEVTDFCAALYADSHGYQTVVFDTLTALERLVFAQVCADDGRKDLLIEKVDGGYRRGYKHARAYWAQLWQWWEALNDKGISVVLLGHAKAIQFRDPQVGTYDQWQLDLDKDSVELLCNDLDILAFLRVRKFASVEETGFGATRGRATGQQRVLYTSEQPAFHAKNRYGLPAEIQVPDSPDNPTVGWQAFADEFAAAITRMSASTQ